jgi:tRNA (guanine-N7-)-methyltransferase
MRMRNKKHCGERMERCGDLWVKAPEEKKGHWQDEFSNQNPIHIEIGCGKGSFIVGMAKLHPTINFIAIERVTNVLVLAMEKAMQEQVENVRFIAGDATGLEAFFAPQEFERIYLNFSDPWPKKRYAKRRLTHQNFLTLYKRLLKPGDFICFKTDNQDLFEFSLNSFCDEDFKLSHITFDLHQSGFEGNVMTEYELRFSQMGQPIYRVEAACPRIL